MPERPSSSATDRKIPMCHSDTEWVAQANRLLAIMDFLKLIFQRPVDFRDPRSAALSRKNQQTRNPQLEGGEEKEERMARYF